MTRYLKALGLAMIAAFAFSAVAASGASAQEGMLTSDGPVTLNGVELASGTNAFTAFGNEVQCPGSTYAGHKANATPHEFLESGAKEVTITPNYTNCENGEGDEREVHMNSCDYEFYDFTTAGGVGGTYGFLARVECDVQGDSITITGGTCDVHVPEQDGLTGLHATNENNKIRIQGTIHNVTAHTCFGIETDEAEQHQDVLVEGQDEAGETTPIEISH